MYIKRFIWYLIIETFSGNDIGFMHCKSNYLDYDLIIKKYNESLGD